MRRIGSITHLLEACKNDGLSIPKGTDQQSISAAFSSRLMKHRVTVAAEDYRMSDKAQPFERTDEARREFCTANRISEEQWKKAGLDWGILVDIAADHEAQVPSLSASASMYAGIVQGINGVHSVRWRVKESSHLLVKIIRKVLEGREQYTNVSSANYFDIVTDLVGIRALHLFKDDFEKIHKSLSPLLSDRETPVANVRKGDAEQFSNTCRDLGLEVKHHAAGYRSIHYVKTVKPLSRELHMEIQLRTVFEEGWSEVDHQVRYPNFSDDPLVSYASLILNRLSGMADEMSIYTRQLVETLTEKAEAISGHQRDYDNANKRIDQLLVDLDGAKQSSAKQDEIVSSLKEEVEALRTVERERKRLTEFAIGSISNSFDDSSSAGGFGAPGNALKIGPFRRIGTSGLGGSLNALRPSAPLTAGAFGNALTPLGTIENQTILSGEGIQDTFGSLDSNVIKSNTIKPHTEE